MNAIGEEVENEPLGIAGWTGHIHMQSSLVGGRSWGRLRAVKVQPDIRSESRAKSQRHTPDEASGWPQSFSM